MKRRPLLSPTPESEAGFTLVEMLVTLTLLALLSVALLASIRMGTTAWQRSEEAAASSNRIRAVQLELARMIATAYPERDPSASDGRLEFDGTADALTLLSPAPDRPGALERRSLATADGDLTLSSRLELPPSHAGSRRSLLTEVRSLEIDYFGPPDTRSPARWQSAWRARGNLPTLIRLRVTFLDGRRWPELVAAPRIAAAATCTYDALTKSCEGG